MEKHFRHTSEESELRVNFGRYSAFVVMIYDDAGYVLNFV